MFQVLKNKLASLSDFIEREYAGYKIDSMNIDYKMTGNYIDDLGVVHYDPRGIDQAWERFQKRFARSAAKRIPKC